MRPARPAASCRGPGVSVYGAGPGRRRAGVALTFERDVPMMLIRLCFALAMMVTLLAPPDASAQRRVDGDQPGDEPSQDEQRVDPKFQRTAVFYRTAEAPGADHRPHQRAVSVRDPTRWFLAER